MRFKSGQQTLSNEKVVSKPYSGCYTYRKIPVDNKKKKNMLSILWGKEVCLHI
ncbi:hypothetical protein N480_21570 [Pseudoalteromonas luteoviolacea S2607]|nr:hypothetical protein N480_21570 [Pseudoalteromonas luteoviolacea S2607]